MFLSFPTIIQALLSYKYFIYFPVAIVEGPIITVISGFLASFGYLNPFVILLLAIAADVVGDVGLYWAGRAGRRRILAGKKKFLGLTKESVEKVEHHFGRHRIKTILIGKYTHAFAFVVSVAAGVARLDFGEFMVINVLGNFPKSLTFLLVGYFFGKAYEKINVYFNAGVFAISVLAIASFALFLIAKRLGEKYFAK